MCRCFVIVWLEPNQTKTNDAISNSAYFIDRTYNVMCMSMLHTVCMTKIMRFNQQQAHYVKERGYLMMRLLILPHFLLFFHFHLLQNRTDHMHTVRQLQFSTRLIRREKKRKKNEKRHKKNEGENSTPVVVPVPLSMYPAGTVHRLPPVRPTWDLRATNNVTTS